MRPPFTPKEIETVILNSPDLCAFTAIRKDPSLPDNGGMYEFKVKAEMTGHKYQTRVEISVTTGLELLRLVRIIQNENRMTGVEEVKALCADANKYFVASMFTSFDEFIDEMLDEEGYYDLDFDPDSFGPDYEY